MIGLWPGKLFPKSPRMVSHDPDLPNLFPPADNCDGTYEAYCDPARELTNVTVSRLFSIMRFKSTALTESRASY